MTNRSILHAPLHALSVPWNAFIAAFLYYVLLAVLALGGASPGLPIAATAYLAPAVMYVVTIIGRAVRGGAAWMVGFMGETRVRDAH